MGRTDGRPWGGWASASGEIPWPPTGRIPWPSSAAHRQLLGRLLEAVDRAREGEAGPEAKARAAIRTALSLLAADPPSARLLTVEILAVGPEGAKRHDAAVEALASRLRSARAHGDEPSPSLAAAPLSPAEWARVAGMLALVGRRTMAGEAACLPELEDELVAMLA